MRCDLHVHTRLSGPCTIPVARRFCRESYNEPLAVYHRLKELGMDVVTITDHDSMDAAAELGRFDDFFASEEVTVTLPSGTEAHVAVYDLNERQHIEIQARRDDFPRFAAYLREQQLLFGINHLFSGLTGRRAAADYQCFAQHFPAWEVCNSAMLRRANDQATRYAEALGKIATAGSDSHSMRTLASAYTVVPGSRSKSDFLDGLRAGRTRIERAHGGWHRVTADVVTISLNLFREQPVTALLAPVLLALPLVTLGNYIVEGLCAQRGPQLCAETLGLCPVTLARLEQAVLA